MDKHGRRSSMKKLKFLYCDNECCIAKRSCLRYTEKELSKDDMKVELEDNYVYKCDKYIDKHGTII